MRALPLLGLALLVPCALLLAGGCGGPSEAPADAGVADAGVAPELYFGLQKGRCFEYTTADTQQTWPDLGVMVEGIDTNQFKVPTMKIVYVTGGRTAMTDFVAVDGNALVLHKRAFSGGKEYLYDPPLKRLEMPVVPSSTLNAESQATVYNGGVKLGEPQRHTLRVDVFGAAAMHLPVGTEVNVPKVVFTEKVAASGQALRTEVRAFLPGDGTRAAADGFVMIKFNFELDENLAEQEYRLQKVRDLGDNPTQAETPCGATL